MPHLEDINLSNMKIGDQLDIVKVSLTRFIKKKGLFAFKNDFILENEKMY